MVKDSFAKCFVYKTNKGFEFIEERVPLEQDEWPHKWDEKKLYYDVIGLSTSLSFKNIRKALNLAMTTWDLEIDIEFEPVWYDTEFGPQITINFRDASNDDYFKERPSVLAYAYMPGQGRVSGKVVFNNDYIWSLDGKPITVKEARKRGYTVKGDPPEDQLLKTYNIIHVLIHELGHTLGLKHDVSGNRDGRDVMDAFYSGALELSERDIVRILLKYPARVYSRFTHYGRLKKALRRIKSRF
jgi:hypothetical protein